MTESPAGPSRWQGKTLWARDRSAPLGAFLRTESGSAMILVAAIVVAIVWANVSAASYESFWHAKITLAAGPFRISQDLQTWINSGLMTLFFLVVGLETRREFDLGDLRERRRFVLPLVAGTAGMLIPVAIYLSINAGRAEGSRLGRGHVHRHGARPRPARGPGPRHPRPDARLRAYRIRGRRPRRAHRDRLLLQRPDRGGAALVAITAFALVLIAVRLRLRQRSVFVGLGIVIWAHCGPVASTPSPRAWPSGWRHPRTLRRVPNCRT